jgi:1-acyl-sn-glycerol-3-phosphate acyltransferase
MGYLKSVALLLAMILIGFYAFTLGVFALALTPVFPRLRYRSNQFFIVPFGVFARWCVGVKLVVLNAKTCAVRPAVLVGNHQTGLDLAIISKGAPGPILIVAKRELKNIPIFGWFFWMAGNILIDRSNPRSARRQLEDARKLLRDKNLNLAVFPEGTRSRDQQMLPFKKGAFHIAVTMGLPIVPIVCSSLKGKAIWEKADLGGGFVVLSILDPIPTEGMAMDQIDALMVRVRQQMMQEFTRITELATAYDERTLKPKDESCCS